MDESRAGLGQACSACGKTLSVPGVGNRFPGSQASDRLQFSLRKLLGAMTVVCVLLALFALIMPAVITPRDHARRSQCANNLKNLGLAFHNHLDHQNNFPLTSSQPRTGRPGSAQLPNPAGYGWAVALLPYLNEGQLYNRLSQDSSNFQTHVFDASNNLDLGCTVIQTLQCPATRHTENVDTTNSEYQFHGSQKGSVGPARSTYAAFAATHFMNASGLGKLYEAKQSMQFDGNGMIPFPISATDLHQGTSFRDITDGTSRTFMLTETREEAYAAWIDGQATWVIGAWQGNSQMPVDKGDYRLAQGWPESDAVSRAAIGLDPLTNPGEIYLSATRYGAGHDRKWGPSSEHLDHVVNHLFVDGHVVSLVSNAMDRNIYISIISRNGSEPLLLPTP